METTKNYSPFNEEEFLSIKSEMASFGSYLPEGKMGWLWDKCTTLRANKKEPQPCGCKSSAGLWAKCADDVREYIKRVEG